MKIPPLLPFALAPRRCAGAARPGAKNRSTVRLTRNPFGPVNKGYGYVTRMVHGTNYRSPAPSRLCDSNDTNLPSRLCDSNPDDTADRRLFAALPLNGCLWFCEIFRLYAALCVRTRSLCRWVLLTKTRVLMMLLMEIEGWARIRDDNNCKIQWKKKIKQKKFAQCQR